MQSILSDLMKRYENGEELSIQEYVMVAMGQELNETKKRLDEKEKRLDEKEKRLDETEKRLDETEKRLDKAEKRLDEAEKAMWVIDEKQKANFAAQPIEQQSETIKNFLKTAIDDKTANVSYLLLDKSTGMFCETNPDGYKFYSDEDIPKAQSMQKGNYSPVYQDTSETYEYIKTVAESGKATTQVFKNKDGTISRTDIIAPLANSTGSQPEAIAIIKSDKINSSNVRTILSRINPQFSASEKDAKIAKSITDTVQTNIASKQNKENAGLDKLTEMQNRTAIDDYAQNILYPNLANGEFTAFVAQSDMDKFKSVNDTYGHAVGDLAIMYDARIHKKSIRKGQDATFRLGGEEMGTVILISNRKEDGTLKTDDEKRAKAFEIIDSRIRQEAENPITVERKDENGNVIKDKNGKPIEDPLIVTEKDGTKHTLTKTLSIGLVEFKPDKPITKENIGEQLRAHIDKADKYLYTVKEHKSEVNYTGTNPEVADYCGNKPISIGDGRNNVGASKEIVDAYMREEAKNRILQDYMSDEQKIKAQQRINSCINSGNYTEIGEITGDPKFKNICKKQQLIHGENPMPQSERNQIIEKQVTEKLQEIKEIEEQRQAKRKDDLTYGANGLPGTARNINGPSRGKDEFGS